MTEQKPKSFGLIVKSAKTKKQKEEKKLYTIVSCCVSVIFLITILVPLLSKGEDRASGKAYKSVAFDLADLAVDDEAEKVLLEMQKYSDIPKQKIAGGLFDKKQKEERQEVDKKEGLPAAPDEEYKQARQVKQAKKSRGVSRAPVYSQRQGTTTNPGSLSRGGMVQASGGSSGTSATIWTSQDKARQQGSSKANNTGAFGTQQLVAATGAKGRASGLLRAIEESKKGADSQNADTAAQAASDAFTNNNIEAEEDENFKDGMDELAEAFNAEELKKAVSDKDLQDLKDEAEKEKEKQEKQDTDLCKSTNREDRMECMKEKFLETFVNKLIDFAFGTASQLIDSSIKGDLKSNSGSQKGKLGNQEKIKNSKVLAGGENETLPDNIG